MKTLMIFIFCSLFFWCFASAQHLAYDGPVAAVIANDGYTVDEPDDDSVDFYLVADQYPQFPGGEKEMLRYIRERIEYPELARSHAHEGKVVLQFVVQADGRVTHLEVIKGLGMGCDEAALTAFKDMPRWQPAYQGGIAIPVKYVTPVEFSLF